MGSTGSSVARPGGVTGSRVNGRRFVPTSDEGAVDLNTHGAQFHLGLRANFWAHP